MTRRALALGAWLALLPACGVKAPPRPPEPEPARPSRPAPAPATPAPPPEGRP